LNQYEHFIKKQTEFGRKRLKSMHVPTSSVLQVFSDHPLSVFVPSLQTSQDENTAWIS